VFGSAILGLAERGKPEAHCRAKEHAARDDPIVSTDLDIIWNRNAALSSRIKADASVPTKASDCSSSKKTRSSAKNLAMLGYLHNKYTD
jgi:hypothetical protein